MNNPHIKGWLSGLVIFFFLCGGVLPTSAGEMVKLPAACFEMGSDLYIVEEPFHKVCLSSFFIDATETLQNEYDDVMGSNPSFRPGRSLPVTGVTWNEANQFCKKVGKRLPTEAEWEYAAGAGQDSLYPWGFEMEPHHAWYQENSNGEPHPAGKTIPNSFGLHDMNGNVWEWVSDWMEPGYYETSPQHNPAGPEKGEYKILKGGSYEDVPLLLRSSSRFWYPPEWRSPSLGFRCARDNPKTKK